VAGDNNARDRPGNRLYGTFSKKELRDRFADYTLPTA
jgi:hypothetical protein